MQRSPAIKKVNDVSPGTAPAQPAQRALRGLQRKLGTTSDNLVKRLDEEWRPTGFHAVDLAMKALEDVPPTSSVQFWLETLDRKMPHLKAVVTETLERRGIVDSADRERAFLPGSVTHPMQDETAESDMRERLLACARVTDPPSARVGTLMGLIAACNLVETVFQAGDRDAARNRADWIAARDGIVRAVREATAKSEGTWKG